jgi:hypothetical protein
VHRSGANQERCLRLYFRMALVIMCTWPTSASGPMGPQSERSDLGGEVAGRAVLQRGSLVS